MIEQHDTKIAFDCGTVGQLLELSNIVSDVDAFANYEHKEKTPPRLGQRSNRTILPRLVIQEISRVSGANRKKLKVGW